MDLCTAVSQCGNKHAVGYAWEAQWDQHSSELNLYLPCICAPAQGTGGFGAGDFLLALLSVGLTHAGFTIYAARAQLLRGSVLGGAAGAALFSLGMTAVAAKALGVSACESCGSRGGGGS
jgi:hypothetical protein